MSYDQDNGRRRRGGRRKWPWFLLLLVLLAALLVAGWAWYENSEGVDLAQPVAIQTALPVLLTDDAMVVYVVDNSGSMEDKLLPLHQALHEVAAKPTENSEIAVLMFGSSHQMLFDFAEPDVAPWDTAIPSFTAGSGGTAMFLALEEAMDMLPERQVCVEETQFFVFSTTTCRQNRIVLMSDGIANDAFVMSGTPMSSNLSAEQEAELLQEQTSLEASIVERLVRSGTPVDTIAFGIDADEAGLKLISDVTGGTFIEAYY
ncbi:MAG: VWA domain-containing protein [Chloroflexi bacterium]|nr:VWA domain-containing protein [Chloroflexota bacterium]